MLQGLNHEQNMKKMRLLSFMQLAENHPEMTFEMVQSELQIEANEVESFMIESKFFERYISPFSHPSKFDIC